MASATEEVAFLRQKLQESERSRSKLQAFADVAGGELAEYRHKVAELEGLLAGKDKELEKQAAALKQKEASVQRLSDTRAEVDECAQRRAKRLQDLEAAAGLPLPDVVHEDAVTRLQQVADLAQKMRVTLGTACGTLYHGEKDLDNTLDGVVKLLARAPALLLDWQYSVAYEGTMRVLAVVRS